MKSEGVTQIHEEAEILKGEYKRKGREERRAQRDEH